MSNIPPDAICAVEGCWHRYDGHVNTDGWRVMCCPDLHNFEPVKLAGGALNSEQERGAYEAAMRGEK